MKTLAPFVAVCLALLALIAWELRSVTREAATDHGSSAEERPLPPSPASAAVSATGGAMRAESKPAQAALPDAQEKPAKAAAASSTAPTTRMAASQPHAVPPLATRSAVRWASDAHQRRAKQRFVKLREVLDSDSHNEAVLEAALALARELQWHNEACDLLGRLVRLRPEDARLRFELATELMRLERWVEAIPQLRFVVQRQPENTRAWYNLAIAHQALGHLHDARATWDRAAELSPQNPDVFAHRGEVLLDLRDWSAAAADFETTLRLEPQSIDAAMNLSVALSRLGRLAEARQTLLPVVKKHPQHVPLLNRLAEITWALYQDDPIGNEALSDETADFCRRSLAAAADQPEIKALLARASTGAD